MPSSGLLELGGASSADDVRACALAALVEERDVSVRLRNSVGGAARSGRLPLRTVGEYLDAGADAEAVMLREVRNFGRKTARELSALVRDAASETGVVAPDPTLVEAERRNEVLGLLAGERIGPLADDELLSARLARLLAQPSFAERTLADVLDDFALTTAQLLRLPNCGRTSVAEFRHFCRRHVVRRLREAGRDDGEAAFAMLLGRPSVTAGMPAGVPAPGPDPLAVPEHDTLAERLGWLVSDLPPRAQAILWRRNGIAQARCETLEEIGLDYGVTRERIRQVEAKSLKRLAVRVRRAPLRDFLAAEAQAHWNDIAADTPFLRRAELLDARRRLDPHLRLACEIEDVSIEEWLDRFAQPFPFGWLSPRLDRAEVEAAGRSVGGLSGLPIPVPLTGLVAAGDEIAAAIAVELVDGVAVRSGYLMPRRIGARSTRLVRLHAIVASTAAILPMERLIDRYRQLHDDDPCQERDAEIVMNAAPHLFLEIEDGAWATINRPGLRVEPADAPVTARARIEEPGTIAYALMSTLERRGPTRLSELLDEAEAILPDGRSVNSIGPVLLTRRELFVRALPGVYALHDQIAPLAAASPDGWEILLNDTQARLYALARYAGERRDIFPLWSAASERALCRWARHSGGPGILSSLLSVAQVEEWPCGEDERDEWTRLRTQLGRYELGMGLRHGSAYELPDLDRLYAACRYVADQGSISYCAANRLTGRKLDSHVGAGLVAALLRLDAVEEESVDGFRWQRRHRRAGALDGLLCRFETAFAGAVGVPDWSSPLGRALADELRAEWDNLTWVDAEALSGMFDAAKSSTFDDSDDDPLARLMAEQRGMREAERREATLDWLLT